MSYEYSENKLVQDSAGNLLHDELGCGIPMFIVAESVIAYSPN